MQAQTCLRAMKFLKGRARELDSTSLSDSSPRRAVTEEHHIYVDPSGTESQQI